MSGSSDWNAAAYDRLSDPQLAWGRRVIGRLALAGDETVLDAGCGTGRLTALLAERLPRGHVIGVDKSPAMLAQAKRNLRPFGHRISLVCNDLTELDLAASVDAVVSTATFHWIRDHEALFRALYRALRAGGGLVAQCGGGPNLARLRDRVAATMCDRRFAPHFVNWCDPWLFPGPSQMAQRLRRAGFVGVATTLEAAPAAFATADEFREFVARVVLWPHLAYLESASLRADFMHAVTAVDDAAPPFVLDYWRLNLRARKPALTRRRPAPGPRAVRPG